MGCHHHFLNAAPIDKDLVDGDLLIIMRNAESRRSIALRVGIDDKDMKSSFRQRSCDIDRRRSFADSSLLVGDSDDTSLIRMRETHSSELL